VRRRGAGGELAGAFERRAGCGPGPGLVALARRCLAAEPGDRPRDAGEVARAVTAYLGSVAERLRAAELAGAAARASAAGERKRRRLVLGLRAAVLLGLAAAAGRGRPRRGEEYGRTHLTQQINDAYLKAVSLRGQARSARGAEAAALAAQARERAYRAAALVSSGGADDVLAARVRALAEEINAEERDRQL